MENKYKFTKKDLKLLYNTIRKKDTITRNKSRIGRNLDLEIVVSDLFTCKFDMGSLTHSGGIRGMYEMMLIPYEELPLHINTNYDIDKEIVEWRLKIGK